MINHSDIEAELGITTLLTDRMEQAIRDWYDAAIDGKPLNKDADTLSMGWPEAICGELSRLTTLELEATVAGSERADWINTHLQRVLSPRHKKILSVALALGSGIWKPYQSGEDIGVAFIPATGYYPVSLNAHGELTEAVFVDQIEDSKNFYNRLEWMHVLHSPEDYHQKESEIVDKLGRGYAPVYPCVQVISLAYQSSTKDALGAPIDLSARDEWADIEPIAFMPELEKLPVGYFTTPITNTVDVNSDIGAAIFAPAKRQIIDADVQYTRLDWEYEGGELAVDVDEQYLKPTQEGTYIDAVKAKLHFGVPSTALTDTPAHHRDRLFHGIDVNTGIANAQPFYQVYSPSLRDTNYLSGLNAYIRNIESHVGLSYGTFSQVSEVEKTATEIMNSRQKSYCLVSDIQASLEAALRDLISALDFWADQLDDAPAKGTLNITFKWDDSIIIDRMTEMAQWQQEITLGLRSKAEYRMHFYGEDQATAQAAITAAQQESAAPDILQGVLNNGITQQTTGSSTKPAAQQGAGKAGGAA